MSREKNLVRIAVPGESMWAEDLGNNRYKLANIPLEAKFNIDDIVSGKMVAGRLEIDQLLEQSEYGKAYLSYEDKDTFKQFFDAAEKCGGKVEGLMPGVAVIAFPETMNVAALGAQYNVKIEA